MCMLRSVVSAMAANMMLVQCNSGVPISIGVLDAIGISPEHGIAGTTSRGDLEGPQSGRQQFGACVFNRPRRKRDLRS